MVVTALNDPFSYCAAVGDALHPDWPYAGPSEPDAVVRTSEIAMHATPGGFDAYASQGAVFWRCMGGAVYACVPGANLKCWDADIDRNPTQAMNDWCMNHPAGGAPINDVIPASVTGHATIFEWRCRGAPTIVRQVVDLDAAGLNSRIWYRLVPP